MSQRPPTPPTTHPGYHYVAVEAGPEWRIADADDRLCSQCRRPAVAVLLRPGKRGERPKRWRCCDDPRHLYGRWVENGKVMQWRLVADAVEGAA